MSGGAEEANMRSTCPAVFPRANWENATALDQTFAAIRYVIDSGGSMIGVMVRGSAPEAGGGYSDNAVNPAWRETVLHAIGMASWEQESSTEIVEFMSYLLTFDWIKAWRQVSPGADFQQSFWGNKYDRLYELKKKLDPYDLFYAQNAVGSEDWEMSEMIFGNLPSQNSRLCKKGAPR
ncbi:hypothetical protein SLS62_004409 [Diatrype stigma]|uniref:Berberine/berberine-like domain-containing protein n=1 Tax=Diatrype stigma TaxID=117547 RepID=A0AAN9UT98_9PEZI